MKSSHGLAARCGADVRRNAGVERGGELTLRGAPRAAGRFRPYYRPLFAALALTFAGVSGASAHGYPERPVTMLVPAAAGAPTGKLAQLVARHMGQALGTKVLVESGAEARSIAHAAADGYTIGVDRWNTRAVDGKLYQLPYASSAGVKAVAMIANDPQLIVTNTAVPARDLGELIAWVKQNQSTISVAIAGTGAPTHMGAIFFANRIGTKLRLVPYRNERSATRALAAGQMDLMLIQASSALPQLRAGTIKAYAVTAKTRLASAPAVPTVDEAGLPGFYAATSQAILVPKATSQEVVAKLQASVMQALLDPDVRRQMSDLGQEAPAIAAVEQTVGAQASSDDAPGYGRSQAIAALSSN